MNEQRPVAVFESMEPKKIQPDVVPLIQNLEFKISLRFMI